MPQDQRLTRLKKKAASLPLSPGVYIMKNSRGEIIYIGKAKQLKNRVSQYFGAGSGHTEKVRKMVSNVENFDYILCDSEFEAFILESSLIKQHLPKYNILLKDDKGYFYIRISGGEWPRIQSVKRREDDGAVYIGPYNSGFVVGKTVDEANKIFKLPTCSRTFGSRRERPCLNFHIGLCSAPCAKKINHADYMESVRSATAFIKGETASVVADLTERMQKSAEALDFETAARLRDRISAIKRINERQKVVVSPDLRQDVIAAVGSSGEGAFCVLDFRAGRLSDCTVYKTDSEIIDPAARYEFIQRYYAPPRDIPPKILCDCEPDDRALLERWLGERRGGTVKISVPQKGDSYKLVEMCRNNAAEYLAQKKSRTGAQAQALSELGELLGLSSPPRYIEAYDISHTAGSENVAGMVVFYDGVPLRSAYKKFKIKSFEGQNDVGSMNEVLTRRFSEYESHKGEPEGFGRLPDLILLDGGSAQLSAAVEAENRFGITVPTFGMVKDSRHRTRAIASSGGDIVIKANRRAYTLVSTIQEEVHRFAITYHCARSRKSALASRLLEIEGVGKTRAELLLRRFKTVSAISDATVDELSRIDGMTRPAAENVYNYFNKDAREK